MNKLLSYLFFLFTTVSFAQNESFNLELKYHPNSEYSSEFKKSIKLKTEKNIDKETQEYLDSLGVNKIIKGNKRESYKIITKTKNRKENKSISLEISLCDYDYNGAFNKEKIIQDFDGDTLKIIGFADSENNLKITKVLADNKNIKNEGQFIIKLENREPRIEFPKHKIRIGETVRFDHTIYYNVPLEGENIYSSKCIATLVKVKKGIAYFKVSSDQTPENSNYELIVSGIIKFDIEKNFACSVSLKSKLHINEIIDDDFVYIHNYSEKIKIRTEMKNTSW